MRWSANPEVPVHTPKLTRKKISLVLALVTLGAAAVVGDTAAKAQFDTAKDTRKQELSA